MLDPEIERLDRRISRLEKPDRLLFVFMVVQSIGWLIVSLKWATE